MKKIAVITAAVLILTGCVKETSKVEEISSLREYITISFSGKPEFQPHSASNRSMGFCLGAVYEPLWQMKEDGSLVPVLGKKIVSRGKEVDIYLAEDVKWHDGSRFTPADVVYTLSLITSGASVYPKGIIEGASIRGKNCVTVFLTAELWEPEKLFTFPIVKNGAPLSMKKPVGTGMYKFKGKGGFDTFLFEPFKNDSLPPLRMICVRDRVRETELFKSGITDIQFVENEYISDYIPLADSRVIKYPTNHIIYIGFNTCTLSPSFRRAVFYALDTSNIAVEIFGSGAMGTAVPYLSEKSFLYKHMQSLPLSQSELRAGGFEDVNGRLFSGNNEVTVRMGVMPGDGHEEVALALAEALTQIGVQCFCEEWDYNNEEVYDIVIATCNLGSDSLLTYFEQNPCLLDGANSEIQFNNGFFAQIPFIPIAFRCHGVFFSSRYDSEVGINFPLFFW